MLIISHQKNKKQGKKAKTNQTSRTKHHNIQVKFQSQNKAKGFHGHNNALQKVEHRFQETFSLQLSPCITSIIQYRIFHGK